jgi:glycosyltransferase involved in cell wall biosynthesis
VRQQLHAENRNRTRIMLQHEVPPDHNGGSCGIDAASRFNPARFSREMRASIRAEWGVPEHAIVVCFVGRVVREKGLEELAAAFQQLEFDLPMLHVVIAGTPEAHDAVSTSTLRCLGGPRVHLLGWIRDTAPVYAASDILVLPSYREGYPNVILEASAMELPVIATAVPGCTDAVVGGATGTLSRCAMWNSWRQL